MSMYLLRDVKISYEKRIPMDNHSIKKYINNDNLLIYSDIINNKDRRAIKILTGPLDNILYVNSEDRPWYYYNSVLCDASQNMINSELILQPLDESQIYDNNHNKEDCVFIVNNWMMITSKEMTELITINQKNNLYLFSFIPTYETNYSDNKKVLKRVEFSIKHNDLNTCVDEEKVTVTAFTRRFFDDANFSINNYLCDELYEYLYPHKNIITEMPILKPGLCEDTFDQTFKDIIRTLIVLQEGMNEYLEENKANFKIRVKTNNKEKKMERDDDMSGTISNDVGSAEADARIRSSMEKDSKPSEEQENDD